MRLFLDTNVLVSAILFPKSSVAQFLERAIEHHTIVISSFVIEELYGVFDEKFSDHTRDLEAFLSELSYELIHYPRYVDRSHYPYVRDDDDLPIIASAIIGDCDYLITGDKDILEVGIERPVVLSPGEFQRTELENVEETE